MQKLLKTRWFKYIGPESAIINALPSGTLFKKRDGFITSAGEELILRLTPEIESMFTPIIKSAENGN